MGLIEALAYSIPSLVTYGTNMGEEIEDSYAGWVCKEDAKEIGISLEKAIEDKAKYKEIGDNAVAIARRYDWNSIAKRAHSIYIKVIKKY